MKVIGKCRSCQKEVSFDAMPMPVEDTGGREGFFEYDFDCPHCGYNMEGVLGPVGK